jgi:sensor histidine kinase regulating citrate/malate metabolism
VAQVEREATGIGPEEIGLTLEEGKTVLSQVQAGIIS